jgi:ABC-type uncharacterized transport system fused permease/ATPase subunit
MSPLHKPRFRLVKKFFLLAKAFFTGGSKRPARLWFGAVLGLCAAAGVVQIFVSFTMRDFVTALSQRDHDNWVRGLWKFVGLFFISVTASGPRKAWTTPTSVSPRT